MEELKYWIWLSRIENLTPKKLLDLLKQYNNPKIIFNKTKEQLITDGISKKDAEEITNIKYKNNLDKYIEYMQKNKIQIISINDKIYPKRLKEIYDPPVALYLKGNKEILNERIIAMVGCRLCTSYGKNIAEKISYKLSLNNINIISGLAKGIDTYSHLGTLAAKRKNNCSTRMRT